MEEIFLQIKFPKENVLYSNVQKSCYTCILRLSCSVLRVIIMYYTPSESLFYAAYIDTKYGILAYNT